MITRVGRRYHVLDIDDPIPQGKGAIWGNVKSTITSLPKIIGLVAAVFAAKGII